MKQPNRNLITLTNDVGLWNRVFEHELIRNYAIANQLVGTPAELLQTITQQEFCFCIVHSKSSDGLTDLIKQVSEKTVLGIFLVGVELPKSDIISLLHHGVCNVIEQEAIEEIVPAIVTLIKRNMAIQSIGAQYKSVVDHALSSFILGKPSGEILDASLRAEEMFGYTIEELRQIGRIGIIDHTSINSEELLRKRMVDGKLVTQAVGLKKGGERFPIEISSVVFYDETNGEYRTSTLITDISEKEELKALLSQTTDIAKVGGWEWILETNRLSWTDSTKKIHRLPHSYLPNVNEAINFYIEEHRPI
ncbi:MAG: PAS domain S-box protein, partial [Bacteroidota bacterium]